MRALHRAAGGLSAQALYSNKTARALQNLPRRRGSQRGVPWKTPLLAGLGLFALFSTAGLYWSLSLIRNKSSKPLPAKTKSISKIAFGSSSAHDYRSQPVWVRGVIPSDPDVWIWVGDMAYLDEPRVNCDASPTHPQCNCTGDWLHERPHFCMAGNVEHATSKMQTQLANPDYARFLSFMCPGHRAKGLHPPPGSDPNVCPKLILGTYDDHDYSWKHGNGRLPRKNELKQIFLDAIGEYRDSPRRKPGRGIEWKHVLNEGQPGREVEIILLDTRFYRDPLPCYRRRSYCENIMHNASHEQYAWCLDFMKGGGRGSGACCDKDEQLFQEWCSRTGQLDICGQSFPSFSTDMLASTGLDFCEVLGRDQRKWLEDELSQSKAPLKLVVSSSVILANTQKQPCSSTLQSAECICSGDDWECYKPAQFDLLESVSKATGCVVLLTGDLGYSDIRVLRPGPQVDYGGLSLSHPLYQVMSSGLAADRESDFSCEGSKKDPSGLRDHPECDFVRPPSFGMIEVSWEEEEPAVKLQIRDGMSSELKLESKFKLTTCSMQ